jgi:5'-nucleotidase
MTEPLMVAVSARSLYDLEQSNRIFEEQGLDAFVNDQSVREDEILQPGPAFPLVKALLAINAQYEKPVVQVIIVSSIHPGAGLRVLQSNAYHGLDIKRTSFTGGQKIFPLLKAYNVDLFLSRSEEDTQKAVNHGIAAALMYNAPENAISAEGDQIRVALDGDAVIFSDASERIYQEKGLAAFAENERSLARQPLDAGPFAKLLIRMQAINDAAPKGKKPFRLILVTARGGSAQERPIRTLNGWRVSLDEAHFLSGYTKAKILAAIGAHIFVDDQDVHVDPASKVVPAGRVPYPLISEDGCEGMAVASEQAGHGADSIAIHNVQPDADPVIIAAE